VARIAAEEKANVGLSVRNLELVPRSYARDLTWVLVHLLHHIVERDIESGAERKAAGKLDRARVTIRCADRGALGVAITLRNDGRGLPQSGTDPGLFPVLVSLVEELGGGLTQTHKAEHYTRYTIWLPPAA